MFTSTLNTHSSSIQFPLRNFRFVCATIWSINIHSDYQKRHLYYSMCAHRGLCGSLDRINLVLDKLLQKFHMSTFNLCIIWYAKETENSVMLTYKAFNFHKLHNSHEAAFRIFDNGHGSRPTHAGFSTSLECEQQHYQPRTIHWTAAI